MVDYVRNLSLLSPGSDAFYGTEDEQVILGRDGGDTIVLYNPNANPNLVQSDVVLADILQGELPGERIPRDWKDVLVLGDWQQPYYVNSQPSNPGLNEALYILNFQPQLDTIRLHGNRENYQLINIPNVGQGLFWQPQGNTSPEAPYWQQKTSVDLISVFLDNPQLREQGFPAIPTLSLENNYFQFLGTTAPEPVIPEIKQLGTSGHDAAISPAVASATDIFGNVYVVSSTTGSLGGANAGGQDAFVGKYDSNGNQQWIQQFGTPSIDAAFGLDIDDNGDVYLSGLVGKFIFIDGEENPKFTEDTWVTKYDTNGNQLWFREYGSPGRGSEESYGAAVDRDGNIFATGWTIGAIDPSLSGRIGAYDGWISKHDTNGNLEWIKQLGTKDYEFSWAVDTDSQGNVYATGWTLGNLGGENTGLYDSWLAKYDKYGNQLWVQQFGTTGDDAALDINIDEFDNIFLTGYTDSNLGSSNAGSFDAWVARYDNSGNRIWAQQFGTPQLEHGTHVSSDNFGNLFVAGLTEGSLGAINAGSVDSWLAKLDARTGTILDFSPQSVPEPLGSLGLLVAAIFGAIAKKRRINKQRKELGWE